ncbi:hypothetical protein [Rhodoplanes sp. Z2-YC6860]|uniref:hypothetical protein n=1 Tax=Rhodoplanes sp. Z2-YC6860 TaxID=674703 RepID=UPI0012ECDCF9|nr:hypothetical protein [Rhodoplanes sp. Z2-YC6860]
MDSTLLRARGATHLKIVLVSLAAAIVVVVVGINARTSSFDTAATATGPAVVKAVPTPAYAGKDGATIR